MRRCLAAAIAAVLLSFPAARAADAKPRKVAVNTVTDFCGDRYCAAGGAAERRVVPGLRKAVRNTGRAGARVPGAVLYAGGSLIVRAEAHLGKTASQLGLPSRLWCADFMNKIAPGHGTDRRAKSWAHVGRPAARGCIGCVAVLTRGKRGGHVGIVKAWQGGDPVIVSGNHNRRVGVGVYSRHRIVALRQI